MKSGRWVRRDLWLPADIKDTPEWYRDSHPAIVATFSGNEVLVHSEIEDENPPYPVLICRVGQALYGTRARSIEIRHAHLRHDRERDWWDYVQCRVMPQ